MISVTYSQMVSIKYVYRVWLSKYGKSLLICDSRWRVHRVHLTNPVIFLLSLTFFPHKNSKNNNKNPHNKTKNSKSYSYHRFSVRAMEQLAVFYKSFLIKILLGTVRTRKRITVWDISGKWKAGKKKKPLCEYLSAQFQSLSPPKRSKVHSMCYDRGSDDHLCIRSNDLKVTAQLIFEVNMRVLLRTHPKTKP